MLLAYMKNKDVRIALVQMSMTASMDANLRKAILQIELAAKRGAQIVALPELFLSPYFPQERKKRASDAYLIKIASEPIEQLCEAARDNHVVLVAGSVYEKSGQKKYNTALVIDSNGQLLGTYRKMHIPHDPSFYELDYFEPGNLGYCVFQTSVGKIGVLICYDQWFPEAARSAALKGADIIFYPTAIGHVEGVEEVEGDWIDACMTVQRGHAISNNVYVAPINRVGREGKMIFFGNSFVCGPFGTMLARGSEHGEELVLADCNFAENRNARDGWRFFASRRPETYKGVTELLQKRIKK